MTMFLVLTSITVLALAVSFRKDRARTRQAIRLGTRTLLNIGPSLLGMTALVGLTLALIPPEALANLFSRHGWAGFLLISLVGSAASMPAPVAFPLAGTLLGMGATAASVAAFITTLTMVGVVTAPLEAAHFGKRFTIARQALSFMLALAIGALMGGIL